MVSHFFFFLSMCSLLSSFSPQYTGFLSYVIASLLPHVDSARHYLLVLTVTCMLCTLRPYVTIAVQWAGIAVFLRLLLSSGSVGRKSAEQWLRVCILRQTAWVPILPRFSSLNKCVLGNIWFVGLLWELDEHMKCLEQYLVCSKYSVYVTWCCWERGLGR